MTTMLRKWLTHPWRSRRWLRHPIDMVRIARKEAQHRGYAQREGHPYYGPVPPDYWPYPIPQGFGVVYRCYACGGLGYHGSHIAGSCPTCGNNGGVVVAHYGKEEEDANQDT